MALPALRVPPRRRLAARPRSRPPWSLALAERIYIEWTMESCRGSVSEAARVLHIPRRTLQRKLKKQRPVR